MANLALFLKLEGLLHKFERNDLLVKGLLIDTPEMIEIDIVGIKLCKALVERFGGEITNVDDWGKKKLAYEINYIREGHYVLVNFEAGADFVAELNRVYNITDGVMRSIVVNKDEK